MGIRLDPGETPEECLLREIREECNLIGVVSQLVDVWVYEVLPKKQVLIVTYVCECSDLAPFTLSDEHTEYGWFNRNEWENLPMPEGYKHSIAKMQHLYSKNLITRQTKTGNAMYGISGFGLERIDCFGIPSR